MFELSNFLPRQELIDSRPLEAQLLDDLKNVALPGKDLASLSETSLFLIKLTTATALDPLWNQLVKVFFQIQTEIRLHLL